MTLPTLLFALLIAMLCGALYHFVRGGKGWRLLLYFGLSALGFALGQSVGIWRGWHVYQFGSLDVGMGVIGSLIILIFGDWLTRVESQKESGV